MLIASLNSDVWSLADVLATDIDADQWIQAKWMRNSGRLSSAGRSCRDRLGDAKPVSISIQISQQDIRCANWGW